MPRKKKQIEFITGDCALPVRIVIPFNGIARSIVCHLHNGAYHNYRIATLTIENGLVVKQHLSDPYASFETTEKLEYSNEITQIRMMHNWADGHAWSLKKDEDGNDIQDDLNS